MLRDLYRAFHIPELGSQNNQPIEKKIQPTREERKLHFRQLGFNRSFRGIHFVDELHLKRQVAIQTVEVFELLQWKLLAVS
jgi:hypothetical protein